MVQDAAHRPQPAGIGNEPFSSDQLLIRNEGVLSCFGGLIADGGSPGTVAAVDTETLVMARNLSGLVLLYRSTEQPRIWVRTSAGGRTTHRLYSEGLYDARVVHDRTAGWRMILDVLACPDGQLGRDGTMADLPEDSTARTAKTAVLRHLDAHLHELDVALLAETRMTRPAATLLADMTRRDWRLVDEPLVRAAEAARAAVT
jgi:hypothetical protein